MTDAPDNAGVRIPPPLIFLTLMLVGLWYDSPWFSLELAPIEAMVMGGIIAVAGFVIMTPSAFSHKKVGSNVEPWKPTTTIISTGIYGYTRNPIYLGMVLVHGGIAISGASLGAFATLVLAVLIMQGYVIAREERYLEGKFGQDYLDYKSRVRRWV